MAQSCLYYLASIFFGWNAFGTLSLKFLSRCRSRNIVVDHGLLESRGIAIGLGFRFGLWIVQSSSVSDFANLE